MAKRRIINTKFWSDNYVSNLDPSEKLLFLYFLTNPYTNISGAYEISIKQIALDTGFDKEMVEKIIKRFDADDKVHYLHGYIVVRNFIKHQEKNPKVQIGIENEAKNLPEDIRAIVYDSLSYLNSNSNLNSNLNLIAFEEFWKLYPKKEDKKKSQTKWDKLDRPTQQKILSDLPLRVKTDKWLRDKGRYIPMPTTYLNGERWEDSLDAPKLTSSKYAKLPTQTIET